MISMHKSFPSSSPSFPQETNVQQWTAPPEPCWEGFTGVRGLGAPEGPGPPAPSVPGGWKQLWGRGGGGAGKGVDVAQGPQQCRGLSRAARWKPIPVQARPI